MAALPGDHPGQDAQDVPDLLAAQAEKGREIQAVGTGVPGGEPGRRGQVTAMTEKQIAAIEAALKRGERVQLKRLKDGTIKVQLVSQKELKAE